MSMKFQDANALEWTQDPRFPSVNMKVLAGRANHPHASVALARVGAGGEIPAHVHATETETALVLSGSGVIFEDETPHPFTPGLAVTITPGTRHRVINTGDTPLELIAIHTPPVR